jgi:hypothetical protein
MESEGHTMRMEDLVIVSVDDHLVEPPDMFKNQLTATQMQQAPHVVERAGSEKGEGRREK